MSVARKGWAAFDWALEPESFCFDTIVHKTVSAPETLDYHSVPSMMSSIRAEGLPVPLNRRPHIPGQGRRPLHCRC